MTENKRFTTRNGVFYTDNETGWEFKCYGEVVDLLNKLAEENEQLKRLLSSINGSFTFDDNYASWFEDCVVVSKEGLREISLGSDFE